MFKHTSKKILLIFILLYVVLGVLFYRFYEHLVLQEAQRQATAVLSSFNALRTYIETVQKPVIYRLQKEGKLEKDFFDPKLLSASYIARHVLANYIKDNDVDYRYKLAATNPRNPHNKADSFEAGILQKFRSGALKSYSTIVEDQGKKYFYQALPLRRNVASCMRCHSTPGRAPRGLIRLYGDQAGFGEKIGQMRAFISLKVPISHIIDQHKRDFFITLFVLFVLFALFYQLFYLLHKKDLKIQEEKDAKDRYLETVNAQLSERIEAEVEHRLQQTRELQEKERLMTQQNKLAGMGEMIGNIAHQWRQPLTQLSSIMVNLELRQERGKLDDDVFREKMREANEQITFMSETIDDFREFFLPDRSRESYPVSRLFTTIEKLMQAALKNNHIRLEIAIEDDFMLEGYPNEMAQALVNIVSNAKEVFKERNTADPVITLRAFVRGKNHVITITDNAGGIRIEPIEKIFEPYFTTRHASTGTGIGLYMTKTIIEKHNQGSIRVENTREGARFTIVFDRV